MNDPEKKSGVVPDRPNHELGCVFRYGAVPESGVLNCACQHKDDPQFIVPPWE